jgi:hypothetical protein
MTATQIRSGVLVHEVCVELRRRVHRREIAHRVHGEVLEQDRRVDVRLAAEERVAYIADRALPKLHPRMVTQESLRSRATTV